PARPGYAPSPAASASPCAAGCPCPSIAPLSLGAVCGMPGRRAGRPSADLGRVGTLLAEDPASLGEDPGRLFVGLEVGHDVDVRRDATDRDGSAEHGRDVLLEHAPTALGHGPQERLVLR